MRIVVYPHDFAIGGSQINAIDLAAKVRDRGHDVIVYGIDGPLTDYVKGKDLPYVAADDWNPRPAPQRIAELFRLCRHEEVQLIHAYEWPPCLDAYYGAHLLGGVPVVSTVLSMWVSPLVPSTVPLLMGTEELAEEARLGRGTSGAAVHVLEPPIDVDGDAPVGDRDAARAELGVADGELAIVSVSRLSVDLKLDALVAAIDAAGLLADDWPIRLLLVGGGDAEAQLRARADAVNQRAGREVVTLPGPTLDPRPAYLAADVVVGMGSSALRAMAHERPVVVQGERGWSLPCSPETIDVYLHQGFFGVGTGNDGGQLLSEQLRPLLADPQRRLELGTWGRGVVVGRFGLNAAADRLIDVYEAALAGPRPTIRRAVPATARVTARAVATEARYHLPAWFGRNASDGLRS